MKIYTKEMRNNRYSCYATIDGYDHQFYGSSAIKAQERMVELLNKKGITDVDWDNVELYVPTPRLPKPPITYAKNRIDNL